LTAVAFAPDPELGSIDTANGKVDFLLVLGIADTGERFAAKPEREAPPQPGDQPKALDARAQA
jgi:hypothetical protein